MCWLDNIRVLLPSDVAARGVRAVMLLAVHKRTGKAVELRTVCIDATQQRTGNSTSRTSGIHEHMLDVSVPHAEPGRMVDGISVCAVEAAGWSLRVRVILNQQWVDVPKGGGCVYEDEPVILAVADILIRCQMSPNSH